VESTRVPGHTDGATTAGLVGLVPDRAAAEPPLETTTIKLELVQSICNAPTLLADDLLRSEGFTEVEYVESPNWDNLASGRTHFAQDYGVSAIAALEEGKPFVLLGGIHVGCLELFATGSVKSIRDLKGKRVSVRRIGGPRYLFIAAMASYVGIDPKKDIQWVTLSRNEGKQHLADGKVDAFLGLPPDPQELRAKKIGHVLVNTATDRPWSQYFCCVVIANREFVRRNPVATKRVLRAILKATDICASNPERVADFLVDKKHAAQRDHALQALKSMPFNRWRTLNPEDTVRFYALRLQEAGMIKSTPQKIIAQGTDWRFLNELKKELKG
jgi:NitT/TauT family transport system substrate-binding protein